jgi:hypothetical protein
MEMVLYDHCITCFGNMEQVFSWEQTRLQLNWYMFSYILWEVKQIALLSNLCVSKIKIQIIELFWSSDHSIPQEYKIVLWTGFQYTDTVYISFSSILKEISFLKEIWTSGRKLLENSNLKEILRKFRKIEGNVKEIALFLKNPKNMAISKEMRFKICWKSCSARCQIWKFSGGGLPDPLVVLLRVNLGKLFVSPLW